MKKYFIVLVLFIITSVKGQQASELDPNFANAGYFIEEDENLDAGGPILVLPNNQIIMAGGGDNFTAIKLTADGAYDTTFGNNGKVIIGFPGYDATVNEIILQPDGKIVLAGELYIIGGNYNFIIVRLNENGTIDETFNGTGKLIFDFGENINYCESAKLQSDGKIVVAGQTGINSNADFAVARINSDGSFDSSFGINGKQRINVQSDDRGKSVVIQTDGKIIIGGSSYPATGIVASWFAVVRLTTSGQLDTTYSGDGIALAKISGGGNDSVARMMIQADGKTVLLANSYISGSQDFGVVRFTTSGALDTSFSGDGKLSIPIFASSSDYPKALAVQPDGKIILLGNSTITSTQKTISVVRLTSSGQLDTTFNNDGIATYTPPLYGDANMFDVKLQSTGKILLGGSMQNNYTLARIFSGNELSANEWNQEDNLFYPNPAEEVIYFSENLISATIFTIEGKKIIQETSQIRQLDVSTLTKGIYLLMLQTSDGRKTKEKIVIE